MPDDASLRHEFRVSTGRKAILWRKMHAKWYKSGFLIDFSRISSPLRLGTRASVRHRLAPPLFVFNTRHRSDSPGWYSTGCDRTSSEGGCMSDKMGYILSNSDPVRRSSGFRTWPIVFRSLCCICVSNCWGAGVPRPWICRWSADLWSLPCQWHAPAHQSTYSLHRDRGPLYVKQPLEDESIENRIHLAGFDTSSGKMYLRSNHHWRGNHTTIANGSRSLSV